ncbi:MAG: V-type ATP synthase subunit E [Gemmatimonadaceae bacterium]
MAIESLLAALGEDAERAVREITERAFAEAQRIRADAETHVTRRCDTALAEREAELRAATDAQRAKARREARALVLHARNAFLDRVFGAVMPRLSGLLQAPACNDALRQLFLEAASYFSSTPAVVRCRPALVDRLNGVVQSHGASVAPDESVPEGIIVEAVDGSLAVDNTLIGRLRWLRPELSIEIVSRFEHAS